MLVKCSKLDTTHRKLKSKFKELQNTLEKSLEEQVLKNKISILENNEKGIVECVSCKSHMFDICILKKNNLKMC